MVWHFQALAPPAQPPYPGCAFQFHVHALGTILEKPPTVGLGKIVAGDEVRQLFVAHLRALGSRDAAVESAAGLGLFIAQIPAPALVQPQPADRKSTRLNSSHSQISYAVFCLK